MKILFTESDLIGSKLIKWGLNEPVSHVAILFFNNTIFQATFHGVAKLPLSDFLNINRIIYEINIEMSEKEEFELFSKTYEALNGENYDKSAFVYFSIMAARYKIFGIPLPKTNPWNSARERICTEVAAYTLNIKDIDASMMSPYQMYLFLKERENG